MDIIEKIIKKGIYGFDDYFIHDIYLYQMIKTYKLKMTKQDRIDFVNALFKKYSALEVMLEKLNAQTNSLYSLLGM